MTTKDAELYAGGDSEVTTDDLGLESPRLTRIRAYMVKKSAKYSSSAGEELLPVWMGYLDTILLRLDEERRAGERRASLYTQKCMLVVVALFVFLFSALIFIPPRTERRPGEAAPWLDDPAEEREGAVAAAGSVVVPVRGPVCFGVLAAVVMKNFPDYYQG